MADSDDAPEQGQAIPMDALDMHLMRKAKFFENEAMMLAMNLRDVISAGVPPKRATQSKPATE